MKTLLLIILTLLTTQTFAKEVKVLAFAGSTRTDSYNQKLVDEAAKMAEQLGAKVTVIYLKDFPLPFYDADLESKEGMPENARQLRKLMIESDAIIIASPEYNRSVSAVLKNALDWASRDEDGGGSYTAFRGKVFALMSASPGKKGGKRGLEHLRTIIEDVKGEIVSQEVTIPRAHEYFAEPKRGDNLVLRQELQKLLVVKDSSIQK